MERKASGETYISLRGHTKFEVSFSRNINVTISIRSEEAFISGTLSKTNSQCDIQTRTVLLSCSFFDNQRVGEVGKSDEVGEFSTTTDGRICE